ncbi:hypothetical protein ACIQPR_44235 [Streptomyces sp. NPDC091280]|uniref:hypothetical protein n=1 Tax=Streptomyces sp. NPDC091280 TaxID=3365984 RepID=UPI0037FA21DA
MAPSVLEEFENYAYFSVRVDRFFHAANIYGSNHDKLKQAHREIPEHDVVREALRDERTDEQFRRFCVVAVNSLNWMATTGIFSDQDDAAPRRVPDDMQNFAYYTCYCFQWTLFENFVKKIVRRAMAAEVLPPDICDELNSKWYKTKQFLDCIESGRVFGSSPFVTVLPVTGWVPGMETCTYADLNKIRELRNLFIHGVDDPEITPESILSQEKVYRRSMMILRCFASNVQQDVGRLLGDVN